MYEFDDEFIDYDYQSEYELDLLKKISKENIQEYYGTYGDSIDERVNKLIKDSNKLLLHNFYGPSLSVSAICIEVIIRYFLIKPLVQSAFLSDEWADLLTKKITSGNSNKDREILPSILKQWNLDINKYLLSNKKQLWATIKNIVIKRRNCFIHNGDDIVEREAEIALECAENLLQIVHQILEKLGFTIDIEGKWSIIKKNSGTYFYKQQDAFN